VAVESASHQFLSDGMEMTSEGVDGGKGDRNASAVKRAPSSAVSTRRKKVVENPRIDVAVVGIHRRLP